MNENEFTILEKLRANSTEKTISNYLRKVALRRPVTIVYRNRSADEFLNELIQLKKELYFIGHNFNQAVHKLHTLDRIPEFRNWIHHYETVHQQFLHKMEQIIARGNQIYQLWLQE